LLSDDKRLTGAYALSPDAGVENRRRTSGPRAGHAVSAINRDDEITTIEGLPATVGSELHPMQEAWLDIDVAQCGYCQPGQIMAAVALVKRSRAEGREITDADLDELRNVCRCGTYPRIRDAIRTGAARM
jgi:isoquinoline 1-oxidoreductase alpha subunit